MSPRIRRRARRAGALLVAVCCGTVPLIGVATTGATGAATGNAAPRQQPAPAGPTMSMEGDMVPGGSMTVTSEGWQPGATVSLAMNGTVVGTAVADAVGNVRLSMTIPASMVPGSYTMTMTGLTAGGSVATLTEGVTLGSAAGAAAPAAAVTAPAAMTG